MLNLNKSLLTILLSGLIYSCTTSVSEGVQLGEKPFKKLSEYQFFVGSLKELQPNTGVLPYDLNTPLFSDYAEKARFISVPDGKTAAYRTGEVLDFPEETILIKNFYYTLDQSTVDSDRKIMETRLLIHRSTGWEASTYIWNDEQTDAELSLIGDIKEMQWTNAEGKAMQVSYVIPNRNQCKGCHSYDNQLRPIGPKVKHLNKDFKYADETSNQLVRWVKEGILEEHPTNDLPRVANWQDTSSGSVHDRAMAYLDINCGHCHNPHGPAATSGLNLTTDQEVNINLGVLKAPVSAAKGSGGRLYSIVPGHPEQSILTYRMESTDPGAMMPEIGRVLVHEEGVDLIKEWIESL